MNSRQKQGQNRITDHTGIFNPKSNSTNFSDLSHADHCREPHPMCKINSPQIERTIGMAQDHRNARRMNWRFLPWGSKIIRPLQRGVRIHKACAGGSRPTIRLSKQGNFHPKDKQQKHNCTFMSPSHQIFNFSVTGIGAFADDSADADPGTLILVYAWNGCLSLFLFLLLLIRIVVCLSCRM